MSMTVTDIFRYPIKSMGGHALHITWLGDKGIPGDRCWTLRDEQRGGIKGGKRFPSLMGMSARLDAEPDAHNPSPAATITLTDGRVLHTGDADINDQLSGAIGSPVSLWPLISVEQWEDYRRQPPAADVDPESALRQVFARLPEEPLPDLSRFPAELMTYEAPPGTYFDAFPLLVMTSSALASMAEHRAASRFDIRRFRPNILVNTSEPGFPEDKWAGKTARLGEAVLKFEMACPRCVMTTHGFDDLPEDPGVMRALVEANNGNLGVYATIAQPGVIKVGDTLHLQA